MTGPRRPKGALERDLLLVCNDFVTGVLNANSPCLTPSHAALIIGERSLEAASKAGTTPEFGPPSPGAVTNIMKKWAKCGYAQSLDRPFGFVNYTEQAYRPEIESADDLIREQKEVAAIKAVTTVLPEAGTVETNEAETGFQKWEDIKATAYVPAPTTRDQADALAVAFASPKYPT